MLGGFKFWPLQPCNSGGDESENGSIGALSNGEAADDFDALVAAETDSDDSQDENWFDNFIGASVDDALPEYDPEPLAMLDSPPIESIESQWRLAEPSPLESPSPKVKICEEPTAARPVARPLQSEFSSAVSSPEGSDLLIIDDSPRAASGGLPSHPIQASASGNQLSKADRVLQLKSQLQQLQGLIQHAE